MRVFFVSLGLLIWLGTYGQQVGIGTLSPHSSALVEMKSSSSGLLIPRLTTTQRDAINDPAHALLIFNTDNFCLEAYDSIGGKWLAVSCPTACSPCDTCPLPIINSISGPSSVCPYDSVMFIVNSSGGDIFIWNAPTSWNLLAQGDTAILIAGSPGTVLVGVCNQCGCVHDSIFLSIGTAPQSVSIVNPRTDTICIFDTLFLTIVPSNLLTYNWNYHNSFSPIGTTGSSASFLPSQTGTFQFVAQGCNGCGCSPYDTISITVLSGTLGPINITGPSLVCIPDTVIFKAPNTSAINWYWQFPPTWTLVHQAGDSIVLSLDSTDGNVIVRACDSLCNCTYDTLAVIADSCNSFCIAIGGTGDDFAQNIVETPDGSLAVVGRTNSFGSGSYDVYVVKVDMLGNLIWTKTIGGGNYDYGAKMVITRDSALAIGGQIFLGDEYLYVIKLNKNGNVMWAKHAGTGTEEVGYAITETADGGIVSAGYERLGTAAGSNDVYVVKYDASGNLKWTATVGGGSHERAFGIVGTPDNGTVFAAYTASAGQGGWEIYVVKQDSNGNVLWAKTIGGPGHDFPYDIILTSDNGFAIAGYTNSFGAGNYDVYVVKLDSVGNLQWTSVIGGSNDDYGYSIKQTRDGGYIVAGQTASYGAGGIDMYIVKLDAQGNLQWTRTIGGIDNDVAYGIVELSSTSGYALAGYTLSYGNGSRDVYIVKLNRAGQLTACPGSCLTGSGGTATTGGVIGNGPTNRSSAGGSGSSGWSNAGGTVIKMCP
ncbi:MAG: PQQ-like beta-propeller repeat protein [Chlorobi bacterium]|nr:PQQ-like beta-propeller repeat protein [Chlorobiota bacterium]